MIKTPRMCRRTEFIYTLHRRALENGIAPRGAEMGDYCEAPHRHSSRACVLFVVGCSKQSISNHIKADSPIKHSPQYTRLLSDDSQWLRGNLLGVSVQLVLHIDWSIMCLFF